MKFRVGLLSLFGFLVTSIGLNQVSEAADPFTEGKVWLIMGQDTGTLTNFKAGCFGC